jgi:hypothetical protein
VPAVHTPDRPQLAPVLLQALLELAVDADAVLESSQQFVLVLLERCPVLLDSAIFGSHPDELGVHAGWMHWRVVQHYNFIRQMLGCYKQS